MIRLNKEAKPRVLIENGDSWTALYESWCQSRDGYEPRHYAHPEIRSALEAETSSKCAYCEGRIKDVAYTHVEHKLPKRKYPQLVCEWENLTIACPVCNTNKGEYDVPECQLLDPYVDDVEQVVAFGGPMALPRDRACARATINKLDLNRTELVSARIAILERLNDLLTLVERAASEPDVQHSLWLDIDSLTASDGEFASACRYFLGAQIAERGLTRP